jgi:hypothetical protein
MPLPASTCVFFDRLRVFSEDPDEVENACNLMEAGQHFINLGVTEDLILTTEMWTCAEDGAVKNEEEYLRQYWFDDSKKWWQTKHTILPSEWESEVNEAVKQAFCKSHSAFKNPSNKQAFVPILGVWICEKDEFRAKATKVKGPPYTRIVLVIKTPPPGCDFTNPNCP